MARELVFLSSLKPQGLMAVDGHVLPDAQAPQPGGHVGKAPGSRRKGWLVGVNNLTFTLYLRAGFICGA